MSLFCILFKQSIKHPAHMLTLTMFEEGIFFKLTSFLPTIAAPLVTPFTQRLESSSTYMRRRAEYFFVFQIFKIHNAKKIHVYARPNCILEIKKIMQDFSHGIWNVIQNFMHSRIKVIKTKYQISYQCNKLCNQFSILNITKYKRMLLRKGDCYVRSRNWKILISNQSWTYTLYKCKSFIDFNEIKLVCMS